MTDVRPDPPAVDLRGRDDRRSALVAAALALLCAPQLLRATLSIDVRAPQDFNEGWNAMHAAALAAGEALYPAHDGLFLNNYPPLSFHVVAALANWTGDAISAGRMLSLCSLAGLCLLTARAARALGCSLPQACVAGSFLTAVFLAYSHYPGINDPQMFGHVVAAAGLAALLGAPGSTARLASAALLIALAGFVKHNLVALPVSVCIWLALYHRASAWRFLVLGIGAVAALWSVFAWLDGPGLFGNLLSARQYALRDLLFDGSKWALKTLPFLVVIWITAWRHRGDPGLALCGIYTAIATAVGLAFVGGAGVDQNVFFDAYIGCALGLAMLLRISDRKRLVLAVFLVPLAISIVVQSRRDWLNPGHWLAPRQAEARRSAEEVDLLQSRSGPAICMELAHCYWAGKSRTVDPYGYGQRRAAGEQVETALRARVAEREFALIEGNPADWGESVGAAAEAAGYRLLRSRGSRPYLARD
jgi:hypothetical protein